MHWNAFKWAMAGILFAITTIAVVSFMSGDSEAAPDVNISSSDIALKVSSQPNSHPTLGSSVTIEVKVHNTGDANATNVDVKFYDGDPHGAGIQIDTTQTINNISISSSKIASVNWTAALPVGHSIWVNLTMTGDADTSNDEASLSVTLNRAPTASMTITPPTSNFTLSNFAFDATLSSDPDGSVVSYFFDFGDGGTATTSKPGHVYADDGDYTVTLVISDNWGGTASTSVNVTVMNRDPAASTANIVAYTKVNIIFDASNSSDLDGNITNMTWTIDGKAFYGSKVYYSFDNNGMFVCDLTVTDDDGATNTTPFNVEILNRKPIASAYANITKIGYGDWISFYGNTSYDLDGGITNYTWIFPEGAKMYGSIVSYQFNLTNNTYDVYLIVTDDDGAIDMKKINIKVGNQNPIANAGLDTVALTYEAIAFDGGNSYDPDGDIVNYTWNMGDGATYYNESFVYSYTQDGNYTVRLTVVDNSGAVDTTQIMITIFNRAPTAYFPDSTVYTKEPISLNTSQSTDIDGTIVDVKWDLGTNITLYGETTYNWSENGIYPILMTIWDDDGASDSYMFNVTVQNSLPVANFSFAPTDITVGDLVTFNASGSYDPDGVIAMYDWEWNDGTNKTTTIKKIVNHTFSKSGSFRVILKCVDEDGGTRETFRWVYVAPHNDPPIAVITVSTTSIQTKQELTFDGSASHDQDPDGSITNYLWDFGDGKTQYGRTVKYAYYTVPPTGYYMVSLTVTDNGGKKNSTDVRINVTAAPNRVPVAKITIQNGGTIFTVGETIIFDGSLSYDPDSGDTIKSYTWSFGDEAGTIAHTRNVQFAYKNAGSKTVRLTVSDGQDSGWTEITLTISPPPPEPQPPTAKFTISPTAKQYTKELFTFDGSGSSDPSPGGSIVSYNWIFGDGESISGTNPRVTHDYSSDATYMVVLTVTDAEGATGIFISEVTVMNRPPVAVPGPDKTVESLVDAQFSGKGSNDIDGSVTTYHWDFGDGASAETMDATHKYMKAGQFTVTLEVRDDDNTMSSTTMKVSVTNRNPVANAGQNMTVYVGTAVSFSGTSSTDPDGRITTWEWNFGEGGTSFDQNPTHVYQAVGDFTVTLTVTDDYTYGTPGTDSQQIQVTVIEAPKPPDDGGGKDNTPGFEGVALFVALGVALVIIVGRRK